MVGTQLSPVIKGRRMYRGQNERQDVCVQSESGISTYQRKTLQQSLHFGEFLRLNGGSLNVPLLACAPSVPTLSVQEIKHLIESKIAEVDFCYICCCVVFVCNLDDLQVCELSH